MPPDTPSDEQQRKRPKFSSSPAAQAQESTYTPAVGDADPNAETMDTATPEDDAYLSGKDCSDSDNPDISGKPSPFRQESMAQEDTGIQEDPTSTEESPDVFSGQYYNFTDVVKKDLTPTDGEGYIYVFENPKQPTLRKIGISSTPVQRARDISRKCETGVEIVYRSPVRYKLQAEALVHAELAPFRSSFHCKCSTNHREWFCIGKETAIASVDRWVNFLDKQPYNVHSREFDPVRRYLLGRKAPISPNSFNMDALQQLLPQIESPSLPDHLDYYWNGCIKNDPIWMLAKQFFWQVSAVIAWTAVFITSRQPSTFGIMALYILGTFLSMSRSYSNFKDSRKSKARR